MFVVLEFPVTDFIHTLLQEAGFIAFKKRVPQPSPDNLEHIPASATKHAFQLLNNFTVTAHRTIQTLQVTVDNEDQIFQPLAPGEGNSAQRFRLITFAITEKGPHFTFPRGDKSRADR